MAISIKDEFNRFSFDLNKLKDFGFISNSYTYYEVNNSIKITITIKSDDVIVDAYDEDNKEPFFNLKNSRLIQSSINNTIEKIKKECCHEKVYISSQANRVNQYIYETYQINPDHLFNDYPNFGIYRNEKLKWFGLIMNVDYSKINKAKKGEIEIINLKSDHVDQLINNESVYPCYHMNKKYWISIILNDSLNDQEIFNLIDKSFLLVKIKK